MSGTDPSGLVRAVHIESMQVCPSGHSVEEVQARPRVSSSSPPQSQAATVRNKKRVRRRNTAPG
tara:strand:- start:1917 stop:2108 length:192 start_codon:yes stop_codon:yes gene_type:complete